MLWIISHEYSNSYYISDVIDDKRYVYYFLINKYMTMYSRNNKFEYKTDAKWIFNHEW